MDEAMRKRRIERILDRMTSQGFTPNGLSLAIGKHRDYIRDLTRSIEDETRPKTFPKREALDAIARHLNCTVEYLLCETDDPSSKNPLAGTSRVLPVIASLDPEHLRAVITATEIWLERNRRHVPPEKKADLFLALYELTIENAPPGGEIDISAYDNVIRLAV